MLKVNKFCLKDYLKIHNLLFASILFGLIFHTITANQWNIGSVFQKIFETRTNWKLHSLDLSIDKKIPIYVGFLIFYKLGNVSWVVIPMIIYFVYGKRRFSKLIAIAIVIYSTNFAINILYPVSSELIEDYGLSQVDAIIASGNNEWLYKSLQSTLLNMPHYSCFPSDHCSNTLVLTYAIIDFNYFDNEDHTLGFNVKANNTKAILWTKGILTSLMVLFCLSVCFATFTLKIHYFLDFVFALLITSSYWIAYHLIKSRKMTYGLTKFFTNFEYWLGYYSSENGFNRYDQYITWGGKNNLTQGLKDKSLKYFIGRYVLIDLLAILIMLLEVYSICWYWMIIHLI